MHPQSFDSYVFRTVEIKTTDGVYKGLAEVGTDGEYCGGLINLKLR